MAPELGTGLGLGGPEPSAFGDRALALRGCLLDLGEDRNVGPRRRQSLRIAFGALELCCPRVLRGGRGAHPRSGKRRIDLDQELALVHAVAYAHGNLAHLARSPRRQRGSPERAHVTEKRPLRLNAPTANRRDLYARRRRLGVVVALGRRLPLAAIEG